MSSRIELLKNMPVFGALRDDTLNALLELNRDVSIAHDEYFFHQDEQGDCMYVLEAGEVAVIKEWQGQRHRVRTLGIGDNFGEMAIIDFFPRSASVLALEDCRAIEITQASLYELHQQDPEQFTIIQMNMGRELSRRLRDADQRIFQAKLEDKPPYEDFSCLTL